jgi:hypothetical protein
MFRTLQDRLVKELALALITAVEADNAFIRKRYVSAHSARFAVKAEQDGSAFVAIPGTDLSEIFCVRKNARSATTTRLGSIAGDGKPHRARCVRTSSKRV